MKSLNDHTETTLEIQKKSFDKDYSLLIVEDSSFFRKVIENELKDDPYQITFADYGEKAVETYKKQPFDLVILDIELPDINGFEVLKNIKAFHKVEGLPEIPVMFLTSSDNIENRSKGFDLGALDFVNKSEMSGQISQKLKNIFYPENTYAGISSLIFEKDVKIRALISSLLQDEGILAFECENLEKSNEIYCHIDEMDLIILDADLSNKKESVQFIKDLRQKMNVKDVPIIVISSYPIKEIAVDIFNAGATDYLQKPFIKEEFLARIHNRIDSYRTNKRFIESSKHLKKLNEFKDKFFAQFVHDMKNPLSVMKMTAEKVSREADLSEKVLKRIKNIECSSEHLLEIINNLLDLRKIELDTTTKFAKVDITRVILQVISSNTILAEKKGVKIEYDFPDNEIFVMGSEFAIQRIYCNILSNAIKFSRENCTIKFKGTVSENQLTVSVSDCGIGMSDEQIKHIFDEDNLQSSRGTKGERGTGIGMSICKNICERHNAELSVTSKEGEGTTFFTIWPVKN